MTKLTMPEPAAYVRFADTGVISPQPPPCIRSKSQILPPVCNLLAQPEAEGDEGAVNARMISITVLVSRE